jgi:hypothetical protein
MAETRTALRRLLSRAIKEPFFQDVPASYFTPAGSSASIIVASSDMVPFWDADDHWNRQWVYAATGTNAGYERRISDYVAATGSIHVTPAFPNTFGGTDQLEIHSRCSATEKHDTINRALREGWPLYWDQIELDLVIPSDVTELTSGNNALFPTTWRMLLSAWLEPSRDGGTCYEATAGNTTTITVSSATWTTNEWAGYSAALIAGAGRGQEATIASNTATVLTLSSTLTTAAASGTEFLIKAPREAGEWQRVIDILPSGSPLVSSILLPRWLQDKAGSTLRLHGLTPPSDLTSDSATTDVSTDYIVNQAASILLLGKGLDGGSHQWEAEQWLGRWHKEQAELQRSRQGFPMPPMTFWQPQRNQPGGGGTLRPDNPFWW